MRKPKFWHCGRGKRLQLTIATDLKRKETCFLQPVCNTNERNKAALQNFLTVGFVLKIVHFPQLKENIFVHCQTREIVNLMKF